MAGKQAAPRHCPACEMLFTPSFKKRKQIYCSRSCCWRGTKGPEFNTRIARESASMRGDIQRGRGVGRAYRKRDGRHEHRVVAERMLGRPLATNEVVHHIDGNKLNNEPTNLAVLDQSAHMREHGLGIKGMQLPWKPWEARWGEK